MLLTIEPDGRVPIYPQLAVDLGVNFHTVKTGVPGETSAPVGSAATVAN
jgi:hypothetical protein